MQILYLMRSKKQLLLAISICFSLISFSQDEDDLFAMLEDEEEQE